VHGSASDEQSSIVHYMDWQNVIITVFDFDFLYSVLLSTVSCSTRVRSCSSFHAFIDPALINGLPAADPGRSGLTDGDLDVLQSNKSQVEHYYHTMNHKQISLMMHVAEIIVGWQLNINMPKARNENVHSRLFRTIADLVSHRFGCHHFVLLQEFVQRLEFIHAK